MSIGAFMGAASLVLALVPAAAQREAPAHAVTCAKCHQRVADFYTHSPMRHAMADEGANAGLAAHPNLSVQKNGYAYTVQTKNGESTYTVSNGTDTISLPIRWAMGDRSQTFVLEKDSHFYESLVSFYQRDLTLATTPGDEDIVPHNLNEAAGRELPLWEVRNCFTCHASGYHADEKLDGQKLTPGLNCERCHEGAIEHMADAQRKDLTSLPDTLDEMNAGETSNFCGRCHRTWDRVVREGWHGPPTVRFQPYRIANSRCFDAKDKRISCLACHDPHQEANRTAAFYDSKCLACHSGANTARTSSASTIPSAEGPKTCPVAKENCVSCHMPKVELAGGHAIYTDHEIRIVRAGDPYPN
ncbi:MAG: multiheme c-type cytochrome [Terracidiphilus sp.]